MQDDQNVPQVPPLPPNNETPPEPQADMTPPAPQPQPAPTFQPFAPLPPIEPAPTPQMTPPVAQVVEPVEPPKKSKKKWFIIGGAALLVIALLIGGYFFLKNQADTSAKAYALKIDTHLDSIFEKETRGERVGIIKEHVTLDAVPLGSLVSPSYKNAEQNLKPLYEDSMNLALDATQSARDLYEEIRTYLTELQESIDYELPPTSRNKSITAGLQDIEKIIDLNLDVANKLDAATDKFAEATTLKKYPSYETSVAKAREWAEARREIAGLQLIWFKDLMDITEQHLTVIVGMYTDIFEGELTDEQITNKYKSADDIPSLDMTQYTLKDTELRANYGKAANAALDEFAKLIDETKSDAYPNDVQDKIDKANARVQELDKKLRDFLTEDEIKNN